MRYLVTGGAGFIGSNIVSELLRQGQQVVVLDNFATGKRENILPLMKNENLTMIEGDLRSCGFDRLCSNALTKWC